MNENYYIYYECPKCKAKYLPCDLVYTKCSENQVGGFLDLHCPKCKCYVIEKIIFLKELQRHTNN